MTIVHCPSPSGIGIFIPVHNDSMRNLVIILMAFLFTQCISAEKHFWTGAGQSSGTFGPKSIYVPEYHIYRNGKYHFVKGHYRYVINPAVYRRRSLQGYGTKLESASIR